MFIALYICEFVYVRTQHITKLLYGVFLTAGGLFTKVSYLLVTKHLFFYTYNYFNAVLVLFSQFDYWPIFMIYLI